MDLAPIAYQYGIGLIIMLVGLWAGYRTGVWGPGRWAWAVVMVLGWMLLLSGQAALQLWAAGG